MGQSLESFEGAVLAFAHDVTERAGLRLLLGHSQWTAAPSLSDGWDSDAGFPDVFEATVRETGTGATAWIRREGRSVRVRYTLVTDEP